MKVSSRLIDNPRTHTADFDMLRRRVCEVRLFGQHKFDIKQQKYKVSDELKEGQARVLFGESKERVERGIKAKGEVRLHCRFRRRLLDRHRFGHRFQRANAPRIHFQVSQAHALKPFLVRACWSGEDSADTELSLASPLNRLLLTLASFSPGRKDMPPKMPLDKMLFDYFRTLLIGNIFTFDVALSSTM